MKKTKIITISLLGLLLLIPFMRPSRAQVPSYVGITVGNYIEWYHNIYVGAPSDPWDQWQADDMTAHWSAPFGHIPDWDDMDSVYSAAGKGGGINPIYIYHYEIDSIFEDITPGRTQINASAGTYIPNDLYDINYNQTIFIGDDTTKFAEDCWYGAVATSALWVSNAINIYNTNTLLFAPKTVNWMEFAVECNAGLEADYGIWGTWGYNLTVTELANGFTMFADVGEFGTNTETINITTTYDADGVLDRYSFEYGSNLLTDIVVTDPDDPVITDVPSDFSVVVGYSGITINWTATDANPGEYEILQNGTAVVSPTSWTSGVEIVFDVPDGLPAGDHLFRINFADERGNTAYDEVIMTVQISENPPESFTLSTDADLPDDDGIFNLSWTNSLGANNYSLYIHNNPITIINSTLILLVDQIAVSPFSVSELTNGEYYFVVVAHNQLGDTLSNNVHVTVSKPGGATTPGISGYNTFVILGIVIFSAIIIFKKKKIRSK